MVTCTHMLHAHWLASIGVVWEGAHG